VIEPTEADIGRAVVYHPRGGKSEDGIIRGFNRNFVFVQYKGDLHSKATRRNDLTWKEGDN
jgi:hypothetical protein